MLGILYRNVTWEGVPIQRVTVGWFGGSGPTLMKTVEYFTQLKFYPLGGI